MLSNNPIPTQSLIVESQLYNLQLKDPWKLATSSSTSREILYLSLAKRVADKIYTGFGEAAWPPQLNQANSISNCFSKLQEIHPKLEKLEIPFNNINSPCALRDYLKFIENSLFQNEEFFTPLKSAINISLIDLIGKIKKLPADKLLGIPNFPEAGLQSSFSIGISDANEFMIKMSESPSFQTYKLKVDACFPSYLLSAIRTLKDNQHKIYIDANCAWDNEDLLTKGLVRYRLAEIIEQPCPVDQVDLLVSVKKKLGEQSITIPPILADESCHNLEDLERIQGLGFDGVVIKIDKCGGLTNALEMIERARSLELKTMLSCMISSSLSITAASILAPMVDYIDLDAGLLIYNDPCLGAVLNSDGTLTLDKLQRPYGVNVKLNCFE